MSSYRFVSTLNTETRYFMDSFFFSNKTKIFIFTRGHLATQTRWQWLHVKDRHISQRYMCRVQTYIKKANLKGQWSISQNESSNEDAVIFFLISKSSKYKAKKGHFIDAYKGTVRRSVRGGIQTYTKVCFLTNINTLRYWNLINLSSGK